MASFKTVQAKKTAIVYNFLISMLTNIVNDSEVNKIAQDQSSPRLFKLR